MRIRIRLEPQINLPALTQKIGGAQQGNGRFFSAFGNYSELDPALLDVKDRIGALALGKHRLVFF